MAARARILIADDLPDVLEALRLLLKPEGYEIVTAPSPAAVIRAVGASEFDLVVIDLNYSRDTTSGIEGIDLLEQLHAWDSTLPVVVMTAFSSLDVVVEVMKKGARDFVPKPWQNERLLAIVRNQVELGAALRRSRDLEGSLRIDGDVDLITQSAVMRPVLDIIQRVAPSDANVLIRGENGSGKGVVARALHSLSSRSSRPMVSVNVGGFSEGVFESELFGHVKGAFTDAKSDRVGRFELADHGTLFLDEIANIPAAQQAKLLRIIETGEFERVGSSRTRQVDVRLISATNAALEEEVQAGRFRQDLLFRLNTVEIVIPPLRDRRDDIPLLASYFLRREAEHYRKKVSAYEPEAMKALTAHGWPGNVRELEHVVERAVLMASGPAITRSDLALQPATGQKIDEMSLEEVEELLIRKALVRHAGNVSHAAEALGLSRSALYRRMQRYAL